MNDAAPSGLGPPLRRYWLCGSAAIDALGAAIDPPDWEDPAIPMTIVALDDSACARCAPLAAHADHVHVLDASEAEDFGAVIARLIHADHASHIQLCLHAVADFGPAIELLEQLLATGGTSMVIGQVADIGETITRLAEPDTGAAGVPDGIFPERIWVETGLLRRVLEETPLDGSSPDALARLLKHAGQIPPRIDRIALILGARFIDLPQNDESMRWRARAARAFARVDWLEVDHRHRWLRELAVRRKMDKRAERQRAQLRDEINVLHAKLGAPWSAARARLRSGQIRRSRLAKALRPWK